MVDEGDNESDGGGRRRHNPFAAVSIQALATILKRVCGNPSQPMYNHYMFEAISALVKFVAGASPSQQTCDEFERLLFPPFQDVLQKDVAEFAPYVFQILAQMLEMRKAGSLPVSQAYKSLLAPCLTASLWQKRGNVPALCRLLVAYVRGDPALCQGHLQAILGCWQKALGAASTEDEAFDLIGAIAESLPLQAFDQFVGEIMRLIVMRLNSHKTVKFVRGLLGFLGLYIGKHGVASVVKAIDALQQGLFWQLLSQVWVTQAKTIKLKHSRKACAIAGARIIAQAPELLQQQQQHQLFAGLLVASIDLLETGVDSSSREAAAEEEAAAAAAEAKAAYSAAYAQLHFSKTAPHDPFPEVDPSKELANALGEASSKVPGVLQGLLQSLPPNYQTATSTYLGKSGVSLR